MPTIDLPPVTDAHRRAAFAKQHWPGLTFEQAMAVDIRRRIVEACAHQIRTQEFRKGERHDRSTRCQHALLGARNTPAPKAPHRPIPKAIAFDGKRAAAGDFDD